MYRVLPGPHTLLSVLSLRRDFFQRRGRGVGAGGGGGTHPLGVGTNCKTTVPILGTGQLLDLQYPNLQHPLSIEGQSLQISSF